MKNSSRFAEMTFALGLIGLFGLAMDVATATPAAARCIVFGKFRQDISNADCNEAHRTGCIRHMLTPDQYRSCLDAQPCVINLSVRSDISKADCSEAQRTGCIQHLLTPDQFQACLAAQPH